MSKPLDLDNLIINKKQLEDHPAIAPRLREYFQFINEYGVFKTSSTSSSTSSSSSSSTSSSSTSSSSSSSSTTVSSSS